MLGGAIGSAARFLVGRVALAAFGPAFPWGTLAVNLAGGLAMGAVAAWLARASAPSGGEAARLLIAVGVLGGFTTFSAFSLEVAGMIERGDWSLALGYAIASVVGSVLALFAGLAIVRGLA